MKTLLALLLTVLTLSAQESEMAGLMLNMGYMNADMNANFAQIPTNDYAAGTNYMNTTISNTVAPFMGLSLYSLRTNYAAGGAALGTNMVKLLTNSFSTNVTGLYSLGSTNLLENTGDRTNDVFLIPLPGGNVARFDFRMSNLETSVPFVAQMRPVFRLVILIIWYLLLAWWLMADLKEELGETMNQRQTQGTHISVLGTEASGLLAAGYAIQITIHLGVAVAATLGFIIANVAQSVAAGGGSALLNQLVSISTWPMWSITNSFVPIVAMLTAYLGYLAYRYLVMWPTFLAARALIFWLVV